MTLPTSALVNNLSREELIALVQQLVATVQGLQVEVHQLRAEVARLKQPATTSQNSSQPPSRDQKPSVKKHRSHRRRGARPGHAKAERPWVERPDQVIEARVSACARCGTDLQSVTPRAVIRRQVVELPPVQPVVIETQQHQVVCPVCQHRQQGTLPEGLEASRHFGPRLEATIVYLQHQQRLSYERTHETLAELFGLTLSEGGQASILERAGAAAHPVAEALRREVVQSPVIGSDETGARLDGQTWWEWVLVSTDTIYHRIDRRRNHQVLLDILEGRTVDTWVSDCWKPHFHVPAKRWQLCLAHQVRNLQGLRERCPRLAWARELQALFRSAMHVAKRRAELTERGFRRRVSQLERRLDQLLARDLKTVAAQALLKRYRKHREHLFVFLHDPRVPYHNNACERALRPSVVHRKVTGGFRSIWGAQAYAALASLIDTAKLRGQSVFQTLVQLMGKPVLPYLSAQIP
jgi:transposase